MLLKHYSYDARKREREEEKKVTNGSKSWIYPPSDVCGRMWWSVWGWACLWGSASEGSRRWVWDSRTLVGSDNDGASLATSAGYSCISALSWTPSLLQDWQLQWKILSTSLSTWGDSSLSGQSRVTCSHTHTHAHPWAHLSTIDDSVIYSILLDQMQLIYTDAMFFILNMPWLRQ